MDREQHSSPGLPIQPGTPKKAGNGSTILCVTDPQGFIISMDVDRWETHIVRRHPEMKEYLEQLKGTVESPEIIQQSLRSSTTFYYYRLSGKSFYKSTDVYVGVVVERNEHTKSGIVKTAHLLRQLRRDGANTVWLKST